MGKDKKEKLIINSPALPIDIKGIVFNGKEYPIEGCTRITFEVLPREHPILRLSYHGGIERDEQTQEHI